MSKDTRSYKISDPPGLFTAEWLKMDEEGKRRK
jgi:hypothetical protein